MSLHVENISAEEALSRLKNGNLRYLAENGFGGNISPDIRKRTFAEGQTPYAIVITCSDSRVIPECIFDAGIGELFVIRVAGNVIGENQLGSIQYAAEHLGCRLALVLGHDRCGAVGAAMSGGGDGFVSSITDEIKHAIGSETDELSACRLNVLNSVGVIRKSFPESLVTVGAIYRLEDGRVEFI